MSFKKKNKFILFYLPESVNLNESIIEINDMKKKEVNIN